jgi:hypothetical protein
VDPVVRPVDPLPPGGGTRQPDHQPQAGAHHYQQSLPTNFIIFTVNKHYDYNIKNLYQQVLSLSLTTNIILSLSTNIIIINKYFHYQNQQSL